MQEFDSNPVWVIDALVKEKLDRQCGALLQRLPNVQGALLEQLYTQGAGIRAEI